jgi:hypothetical protein
MSKSHLANYLNDHLAGSEAGLELVEHIVKLHVGQPGEQVAASHRPLIPHERHAGTLTTHATAQQDPRRP